MSEKRIQPTTSIIHDTAPRMDQPETTVAEAPPTSSTNHANRTANNQSDIVVQVAPLTPSMDKSVDAVQDNGAMPSADSKKSAKFSLHQKLTFLSACLATLADVTAFSLMSPFFPIEAAARGLSSITIGFTFSMFSFACFLASPLFGKILPAVGARFVFLAGSFVSGGCCILFGFLEEMPSEMTFTVYCFVLRAVSGIGAAAGMTASAAIIAYTFPDNVGLASSVNEMVAGIGSMIGPAIGGTLYSVGGFKLPFIALGVLDLVFLVINFFLMPQHGTKNEKMGSMRQVLRIPAVWMIMIVILMGSTAIGFLDPTLSPHLKELDFTIDQIGYTFLGFSAIYAITAIAWGYLADKTKATRIIIVMGTYGGCITFLLLGPSPYLNIPFNTPIVLSGLCLGGVTIAMMIMPSFLDMLNSAQWYGIPNDLGLNSIISGVWSGVFSLGAMLGPILGGALKQDFGFGKATTLLAAGCIITMLVVCFFAVWEYRCGKGKRVPPSRIVSLQTNSTEDERRPLLKAINA